jgi:hypothetical protein
VASVVLDLGTYRGPGGELVHCWYDGSGALACEREGPHGRTRVDPSVVTRAVKLSDDPYWPEADEPVQEPLWRE